MNMNPTMMMMAMANQRRRKNAPADRITNRPTKAQVAWIDAIEKDDSKEVINVSEGSPVTLSVEILDHSLSLTFGAPVLVTVVLDLLANEKSVDVRKTGVVSSRLICWEQKHDRQQTNCWCQKYGSSSTTVYWDTVGLYWRDQGRVFTHLDTLIEKVARAMFNSATDGGSAGYRGSKITNASIQAVKLPQKKTA
jgi:hypothetical protein